MTRVSTSAEGLAGTPELIRLSPRASTNSDAFIRRFGSQAIAGTAKADAHTRVVDGGGEAVRPGKRLDGLGAFSVFPALHRPDPLQFFLEDHAGFANTKALFDVAEQSVQGSSVTEAAERTMPFFPRCGRYIRPPNQPRFVSVLGG